MRKEELLWAAGLFDGEGCISLIFRKEIPQKPTSGNGMRSKRNPHWVIQISLGMSHEASVRRFNSIVGQGKVYERSQVRSPNHQKVYDWIASSQAAEETLKLLAPYLFTKHKQALLALEVRDIQKGRKTRSYSSVDRDRLEEIKIEIQNLNGRQKSGHLYVPTKGEVL